MVEPESHRFSENIHPDLQGPDYKTVIGSASENGFLIMIFNDHGDKGIKIEVQDIVLQLTSKNQAMQITL